MALGLPLTAQQSLPSLLKLGWLSCDPVWRQGAGGGIFSNF